MEDRQEQVSRLKSELAELQEEYRQLKSLYDQEIESYKGSGRISMPEQQTLSPEASMQSGSEKERIEAKLKLSEHQFGNIWESGPFGMMIIDSEGKIIRNNRYMSEMLGYSDDELRKRTFREISNKEDLSKDLPNIKLLDEGKIPFYKAEKRYIHKNGSDIWGSLTVTANFDEAGKLLHKVAIIEDITQKLKTARELSIISDRLKIATQSAGIGIWDWDIIKNELIWDDEMYRLYGINPLAAPPAYQTWLDHVHPEDREKSDEVSRKAVIGESEYDTEFRIVWNDGSVHWLKAYGQVFYDPDGKPNRMVGVNYDISLIHETMDNLVESELSFSSVFNDSPIGITLFNSENLVIRNINQSALNIIGYTQEEIIDKTTIDIGLVLDMEERNSILDTFRETGVLNNYETKIRAKDGSEKDIIISVKRISIHNTPVFLSMMIDNTVRKKAENELMVAKDNFSTLFFSNPTPMAITTVTEGNFILVNESYSKITGYELEELIGKNTSKMDIYIHPEERNQIFKTLVKFGKVKNKEISIRTKSGEIRTITIHMEYIHFSGTQCILSAFFDISERKLIEDELVRSKLKLETALESMTDAVFITDSEGNFLDFNDAYASFLKFGNKAECYQTLIEYPEYINVYFPNGKLAPLDQWAVPRALRGEIQSNVEYFLERKDTGEKWVGSFSFSPIKDENGTITGSVVVGRDITEQKKAELALHASEERYRQLVDNYPDGAVMVFDRDNTLRFAAGNDLSKDNILPENIIGKTFLELFQDELWNTARPHFESAFSGNTSSFESIYKNELYYFVTLAPLHNPDGSIGEILMLTRDETERKKAQYSLMEKEALYSTIFNASPFAIALTDLGTNKWVEVNRAFEINTGYSREEAIGKSATEVGLWKDSEVLTKIFETYLEEGRVSNFEVTIRRKDNSDAVNLMSVETVYLDGKPFSLVLANDITELKKAENEVARQQSLLKEMGKIAKIGGWEYDARTKSSNWTDQIFDIYEMEKGKDVFVGLGKNYYTPDSWKLLEESLWRAVNEGRGYEMELELRTAGNTSKWVHTIANPEVVDGVVVKVNGSLQDITEMKKMQVALRKSETEFKQLVWDLQAGVILHDSNSVISLINPKAASLLGFSEEGILGKSSRELNLVVVNEDGILMKPEEYPVARCIKTLKPVHNVVLGIKNAPGKDILWLLSDTFPQLNEDGSINHILTSIYDITVRKNVEQAVKIQSERLNILHSIDIDILRSLKSSESITGSILVRLKSLLRCDSLFAGLMDNSTMDFNLYGVDENNEADLSLIYSVSREDYGDLDVLASEKIEVIENTEDAILPEKMRAFLEWKQIRSFVNMPLYSAQAFYGVLHIGWSLPRKVSANELEIIEEVSNQLSISLEQAYMASENLRYTHELEDRVRERTKQLEESNKELEAFSYSVSHDLRAPLRHINGYIDIISTTSQDTLSEQSKHYMRVVADSAKQMGTLIDDLLEFSRTGRKELRKSKPDLNVVLSEVISSLQADIIDKPIEWKISNLPTVTGDQSLLRQVLFNLVSNAVKFSQHRNPAIIEIGHQEQDEEYIFYVRDNGAGFNMKYAHKLFGVFQRLHSANEFEGTGIGLANVRRIISKHGGRTWAESEQGKGATFYFTIPKTIS